ncbi:hypothetical protein AAG663_20325 [Bacillus licheniformis]
MKLIGIGLLLLASLEAFAVMLDVFQGMTLQRAIVNFPDVCHPGSGRVDHHPFIFVYHFSRSLGKLSQKEKKDIKGSLSKGSLNFDISIDCICLVGMDHSFDNRIADDERLP